MDGRTICADGMTPFSRNGKCRRLSSLWLDGRLHFLLLYYITSGEGVDSMGGDCGVNILEQKAVVPQFYWDKDIVFPL